jgi:hypothetical protein
MNHDEKETVTHLVRRGGGRFRVALCGRKVCPAPNVELRAAGYEGACNNPQHVDCLACLELEAGAA